MLTPRLRRAALVGLKLIVSSGLLWFVLRDVDMRRLGATLTALDPLWIALALGAYGGLLVLSVWRWQVLLRAQHVEVPSRRLWSSLFVALFFNNFLPSNIGGDVWRVADTAGAAGSKTVATTVVLLDRALGLVALFIVAAAGAAAADWMGLSVPGAEWLWIAVAVGLLAGVPFLAAPRLLTLILAPVRATRHDWSVERAAKFEHAFMRFRAQPAALVAAFTGAIAVQMVPVSINGFGVREAVFVYFFARFGLTAEAAVALSLLGALLVMLVSLWGGVLFLLRGAAAPP
jgi:uncharacterized membrane protein YbhN (UPF0104 family)